MNIIKTLPVAALVATTLLATSTSVAGAEEAPVSSASVVAEFEGGTIRLADGWGEATACHQDDADVRCYRSEAEMDRAEVLADPAPGLLASCSSSLKLYRSTGQSGGVLQLTQRGVNLNLATFGFSNDTESYRVGACSARFYDATSGTGTSYPGWTGAFASSSWMLSGWANRVSSVRIS